MKSSIKLSDCSGSEIPIIKESPTIANRLQQILFYKELGLSLESIKEIVTAPSFNATRALWEHHAKLLAKKEQLDLLIANVEKTIALKEGRATMTDQEKFVGFKQKLIEENEEKYGQEIRNKYGDQTVDQANRKLMNMSPEQYEEVARLGEELLEVLNAAFQAGDPAGDLAQEAVKLHRQWLSYYWHSYSKEAHIGLAQMYVDDERFRAYYDQKQPGTAAFLRDAVRFLPERKSSLAFRLECNRRS
jgi:DNA-binding transcriptional MerR regulator